MEKSPDAFRTISEVAEWLDVPTHVLRFWESRFSQIKPVKRAGGRRYYRPSDMKLIGGVKALLHDEGMTIRGVQKLLREKGIKHVAGFSKPLDTEAEADDGVTLEHRPVEAEPVASPASEPQPVMPMMPSAAATATTKATPIARSEPSPADVAEADGQADMFSEHDDADAAPDARPEDREGERRIPETPDVPKVDPADDDPTFPDRPGLAARIALAPKSRLIADRDVVRRAVEKLSVISQRAR